ncbi:MAG: signal peptidase I [Acidobacteria bacterium]|nr:signal peptidase I [Acidobacteriota bacterium]
MAAGADNAAARPAKSVAREYLETIVVCVLFLLFARTFVFMQSKIPTESMLDTLLVGDYILVNRFGYGAPHDRALPLLGQEPIRRGDVVVFRFPEDPDIDFVKRVIGLPGETVQVSDWRVSIDGKPLAEPYIVPGNFDNPEGRYFGPVTVPADSYFCMGDNRDNSRDSRAWGFVPRSLVKGRAFFIWYSYEEDPNDHLRTGTKRIYSILKKLVYFPMRTRWSRIFDAVH